MVHFFPLLHCCPHATRSTQGGSGEWPKTRRGRALGVQIEHRTTCKTSITINVDEVTPMKRLGCVFAKMLGPRAQRGFKRPHLVTTPMPIAASFPFRNGEIGNSDRTLLSFEGGRLQTTDWRMADFLLPRLDPCKAIQTDANGCDHSCISRTWTFLCDFSRVIHDSGLSS